MPAYLAVFWLFVRFSRLYITVPSPAFPLHFSVYHPPSCLSTHHRLLARIEAEIEKELLLDKNLINNTFLSVVSYNRTATGDSLVVHKATICLPAIIAW